MPAREFETGRKAFQVGHARNLGIRPRVLIMVVVTIAAIEMVAGLHGEMVARLIPVATTLFVFAQGMEIYISQRRRWSRQRRRLAFAAAAAVQGLVLAALAIALIRLVAHNPHSGAALFGWLLILGALGSSMVASRWSMLAFSGTAMLGVTIGIATTGGSALVHAFAVAVLGTLLVSAAWASTQKHHRLEVAKGNQRLQTLQSLNDILLQETLEGPQNWAWRTDEHGRMSEVTPGFERATGLAAQDWVGLDFAAFLSSLGVRQSPQITALVAHIEKGESFRNVEIEIIDGADQLVWRISGAPIRDGDNKITGYVGANFDITSHKRNEKEIMELAHFDTLTGLLNRSQFNAKLDSQISRLERYGTPFSLLLLDLDHFKNVNDNLGHLAGDAILASVAERVRACLRDSDHAARLGGDEFAILLPGTLDRNEIEHIADRLRDELKRPFHHEHDNIHLGCSIGVVIAPLNGTRPNQLLRNADLALYRAKGHGRGEWKFFEAHMDSEMRERRLLETELQEAVGKGEIELYFQPLVDASSLHPVAFEALVRWNHPLRGLVSPAEFIPIAEETGTIIEIGDWSINEACRLAKTWPEDIRIAVNLSPRHFTQSDVVATTKKALARHGLGAHRLELEITEGVLMSDEAAVIAKLEKLKKLGVTIAMDDFGTGYSSLSYLLKFPFDKIKIDKSFVDRVLVDRSAQRVLRAISSLARALKMSVTAEGVESPEQARFLSQIACQHLQGYFFAKPLTAADAEAFLKAHARGRPEPAQKTG